MFLLIAFILGIVAFVVAYATIGDKFHFSDYAGLAVCAAIGLLVTVVSYIVMINIAVIMLIVLFVVLCALGAAYMYVRFRSKKVENNE